MAPPRYIQASKVREYVFCPRSLAYRQRGIAPPPEALRQREVRIEHGLQYHREHGEAVCRAGQQLRTGTLLVKIGLAVIVWGFLTWWYLSSS